ncbi:Hexaprenyldihydroxybenzoate methyltransferase, mitochondrial-like protein [Gossypium australe]|uniref:Hexaprenyldihydroxybenzoate methyltransferase, mitochondrial-like protein n=1 Tax=Gossypium australe TaxID=47621 RepID=A0A5B6VUJ2_9ROSI|nr:Hexaprenyldihydroxybenzoate methyltransferase, mitochondrial-like protein [Gossypium australe]
MSSNQARAESEEAKSTAQASVQRAASSSSRRPVSEGREEFRAIAEDDLERTEFWSENTIRALDELSCTPVECLKCAISLLKETTYQWWNTLIFVVPREKCYMGVFQTGFRKKYINQRFLDQKKKEFLVLKQENMIVFEYEQEFVQLSKYARE